jgi:hypothetical protein
MLAKGWLLQYLRPRWIIETRFRLVLLTAVLVALTTLTQMEVIREVQLNHSYYHSLFIWSAWFQLFGHLSLGYLEFSVAPLIFLILFFPKQNQKTSKRA